MEVAVPVTSRQGSRIEARLIAPSGWTDVPVVVLCHERTSPEIDAQDRNLAGHLESEGIGSLLVDASSLGGASGVAVSVTGSALLKDRIADVTAAIDALRDRPTIDPNRIGFFATGRAGPMGMHLTASEPRIRALVLASSPIPPPRGNSLIGVPTLFITTAQDKSPRDCVHALAAWLRGPHELRIIPRSDERFSSDVAFSRVARDTVSWFTRYLGTGYQAMSA